MTASDTTGLIAGRYRLVSELGRGAMGVVWLARDERLGRTVAVKELRSGVGLSDTQVQHSHLRARREARIAARLHHPHAVAIYDVAEHEGRPYLVMEYVRSRSLAEVLAQDPLLSPAATAEIGAQLAAALVAAHEAGIVHRDIKPGNILITEGGTAKLTDFGISRATDDVTVTATGEMLGTPAYVAPEVAQGRAATAASDVFSLGATLYAAVEGLPPFGTGPTAMALLLRIVHGEIRLPQSSGPLTGTLMWMLRNDPAERPSMEVAQRSLNAVAAAARSEASTTPVSTAEPESRSPGSTTPRLTEVPNQADAPPQPAESDDQPEPSAPPAAPAAPSAPTAPTAPTVPEPAADSTPAAQPDPSAASISERPPSQRTDMDTGPGTPAARTTSESTTPKRTDTGSNARRRPLGWVLVGVAAVVVAGIVAAFVASGSPSSSNTRTSSSSSTSSTSSRKSTPTSHPAASATTPAGKSTTSSASSTSASPSSATSSSADISTQLTSAISHYYQLVPGNLNQAFGYLTAGYQQNPAGGMSGYTAFWDQIQRVSVSNIVAQPPSSVTATIDYFYKDGRTVEESTSFGLVYSGGIWKIARSSVLSSKTL